MFGSIEVDGSIIAILGGLMLLVLGVGVTLMSWTLATVVRIVSGLAALEARQTAIEDRVDELHGHEQPRWKQ